MESEYRKQKMYALIEAWRSSGQSRTAFSKEQGISRSTFSRWLTKYEQEHESSESSSFVQLPVPTSSSMDELKITYPNGVQLICPMDISIDQLKGLVHCKRPVKYML